MKTIICSITLACLGLFSGCTFNPPPLVLSSVGPKPSLESADYGTGSLMVFSAWDALGNRYRRDHSDYKILSTNGKLVRRVVNAICFNDDDPVAIELPSGQYQVLAMSQDAGKVMVPVQIKEGQTTSVFLDGYNYLRASSVGNHPVVKLPNGEIVGWAANVKRNN